MEKLKLSYVKPLAFVKVHTTGLNSSNDRIIEISITRVEIDGSSKNGTRLVNPGIPIPPEDSKISGITDEMIKGKPTFKDVAEGLSKFLDGCDFVGFNIINFDLKFLSEEFNRAGIEFTLMGRKVIDLANIYHTMEPRDLTAAYLFYCGKNFEGKIGSTTTNSIYSEIMNNMLHKYVGSERTDKAGKVQKVEATIDSINNIFNKNKKQLDLEGIIVLNDAGRPVFSIGKCKGQLVSEALLKDPQYYEWIIDVSTWPADTKMVVKKIVEKAKAASLAK